MRAFLLLVLSFLTGCTVESTGRERSADAKVESCMLCHNGSNVDDYAGPGIENPHPFKNDTFPLADEMTCTKCHGGNPGGTDRATSHVPPPPEIGDRQNWIRNRQAYFNRLTMTGIDKFGDYDVDGTTYQALDYLQFINPSDLRVVRDGRACGGCHVNHVDTVSKSPLATTTGIFSGALYAIGAENQVNGNLYEDTAADVAFRAVSESNALTEIGAVSRLDEFPVFSVRNASGPFDIHDNPIYDADELNDDIDPATNRVITNSPLANLFREQVAFTCGDCHLGSAGANNRYGDFRSSGCATCHMPYSLSGRMTHSDPNVPRDEPLDPDDIDEPELPHLRRHMILSTHRTLPGGEEVNGIDDYTCAGCHQGSNRTVMQYWGIRLDQNQDLRNQVQYPAQPKGGWQGTHNDTRLFDPEVNNRTFNGRNANQYILFEDYDGDARDDTPPDIHYEAGMGCIDCHGSNDLHGGDVDDPADNKIASRMEQAVAVQCQSCHGSSTEYAKTLPGNFRGQAADLAMDSRGKSLGHVVREADGNFYLYSRLTGRRHFVSQTRDTVVDSQKTNPFTGQPLYSAKASYAMGRDDGLASTGLGPTQSGDRTGFAHSDTMDCASCHASWTNTCMGCHLEGDHNTGNNFSNITGDRIVFRQTFAEFIYQSPVFFQLGVNPRNRITQVSPNTKMFFRWEDRNNQRSKVFTFNDRNGNGQLAMGHNAMMAHSIRGKVNPTNEGPRYCVACHLTTKGLEDYGPMYRAFKDNMQNERYELLDLPEIAKHFGENPGNQMNSPLWVHMIAGLGSGLFLFDENGCPVNNIDENDRRFGCEDISPRDRFTPETVNARAKFNLDRIVDLDGAAQASNNHPMMDPGNGPILRDGALNVNLAGPLGFDRVRRLTDPDNGIILDSWLNADGQPVGPNAPNGAR